MIDQPNYAAMSAPEMLEACGDSALNWAAALFQLRDKHGFEINEETMLGWFANAIETAHDKRTGKGITVLPDGSAFFTATVAQ